MIQHNFGVKDGSGLHLVSTGFVELWGFKQVHFSQCSFVILSARLLANCCSQEGTAEPFSGHMDVAENSCTVFKPECFHPGCRGLKIYSDLSMACDLWVPVMPGMFLTLSKLLLGILCQCACISGNVHYWCSHDWKLLTGRSRNGIWHISRQAIPSSERSGNDGKRCSRNYEEVFLRGCLLLLISIQWFGLYWQSSVHLLFLY